jgi:hypothetical protein
MAKEGLYAVIYMAPKLKEMLNKPIPSFDATREDLYFPRFSTFPGPTSLLSLERLSVL